LAVYLRRRLLRERKPTVSVESAQTNQNQQAEEFMPAYEALDDEPAVATAEAEPLTAIVEGIIDEPEQVEEPQVAATQAVLAEVVDAPVLTETAATEPVTRRQIMDIQPMNHKQAPAVPQPEPRVLPVKSRTIDGIHRVPARYKTNVQVPARLATATPKMLPKKSIDGFLTVQA
jgi:hypothetical protein